MDAPRESLGVSLGILALNSPGIFLAFFWIFLTRFICRFCRELFLGYFKDLCRYFHHWFFLDFFWNFPQFFLKESVHFLQISFQEFPLKFLPRFMLGLFQAFLPFEILPWILPGFGFKDSSGVLSWITPLFFHGLPLEIFQAFVPEILYDSCMNSSFR